MKAIIANYITQLSKWLIRLRRRCAACTGQIYNLFTAALTRGLKSWQRFAESVRDYFVGAHKKWEAGVREYVESVRRDDPVRPAATTSKAPFASLGEKGLSFFDRFMYIEFGAAYIFAVFVLFFIGYAGLPSSTSVIDRGGFSAPMVLELAMLIYLLFCVLYFFGAAARHACPPHVAVELKSIFISNIVSIFAAYGIVLFLNYVAFTWPLVFFRCARLFFHVGINVHSHDYALLLIKLAYIILVCLGLHMAGKYLLRGRILFQYFTLLVIASWAGLFVMALDNLFYILLMMDAISLVTVAVVAISATPGFTEALGFSLHYYMYSIFTSVLGYTGCFLFYTNFNSVNVNAIVFGATVDVAAPVFMNPAYTIGAVLIVIKFLFLFGAFPFQLVILEVSSRLNFSYLFYFLVVSKLPILVVFLKLMKVLWVNFGYVKYFIFFAGLSSVLYSAAFIATAVFIKEFLALSSMNQMGFVLMLFFFEDFTAVYLALLFYVTYALACCAVYLFFSASRSYIPGDTTDGDMDTWVDLRRFISDSFLLARLFNTWRWNRFEESQFFYFGVFAAAAGVITLAGFPFLAGFFLKLGFIEIFLANKLYFTLGFVLFTTLVTTYAYFNLLIRLNAEFRRTDSNRFMYGIRLYDVNAADGALFATLGIAVPAVTVLSGSSAAFSVFGDVIAPLFVDNYYYCYSLNDFGINIKYSILFMVVYYPQFTFRARCTRAFIRLWAWYEFDDGWFFSLMRKFFKNRDYDITFIKRSYKFEFMVVVLTCAVAMVSRDLYYVDSTSVDYTMDWFRYTHIIIVNFLCWGAIYNISYSVALYRAAFFLYVLFDYCAPAAAMYLWIYWVYGSFFYEQFWLVWTETDFFSFVHWLQHLWIDFYYVTAGSFILLPAAILAAGGFRHARSTFMLIDFKQDPSINAELLREWVRRSAWDFMARFVVRYHIQLFTAFIAFLVFGPINDCCELPHDFLFLLIAVYTAIKFWTANFFLPKYVFWSLFMIFLYCWRFGIETQADFAARYKSIIVGPRGWLKDPRKFLDFLLFFFAAALVPACLATSTPVTSVFFSFYVAVIYYVQVALYYAVPAGLVWLFACLIMRQEAALQLSLDLFYYISLAISLFFINLMIGYSGDGLCAPGTPADLSEKKLLQPFSLTQFDHFNLVEEIFGGLYEIPVLTFGYDFFSLTLCTMTAIIFSFVFLISLHNAKLYHRKLFFLLIFLLEVLTLMTFLSTNLLGFIIFFESTLLPMAALIGYWGSSYKRWFAARQFIFYSLTCSMPALVATVYLYSLFGGRVDYLHLLENMHTLTQAEKTFVWLSFFLLFAVKIPLFPLHSWLLNAHVEAPTAGSIILAAVMLKVGAFGFVRYLFGLLHDISISYALPVCALALISIFFSAISSITETDAKRLVAQTSIAHMGLIVLGLFIFVEHGFYGAFFLIIGHGITATALFYLIGILYDRFHTRDLTLLGGLVQLMPLYCTCLFFFALANAGFPWSLSFVGELFILMGVARELSLAVFFVLMICSVALLYSNLRLFISISFGTLNKDLISNATPDLTHLELFCACLLTLNAFFLMWGNGFFFYPIFFDLLGRYFL